MHNQNKFQFEEKKQFCSVHQKRQVEFLCLKQDCSQQFFCNECFRGNLHEDHSEKIFQLDDIIDCEDVSELTQSIFKFGDFSDEHQILEVFTNLKNKIIQQIDSIQKSLLAKCLSQRDKVQSKIGLITHFQKNIKLYCENQLNQIDISLVIQQLQQSLNTEKYQLIVNTNLVQTQEKSITKLIASLEEYCTEGTRVDLTCINQINFDQKSIIFQKENESMNISAINKQNIDPENSFKLLLESEKTYNISLKIYKNQNFYVSFSIHNPNTNQTYIISFSNSTKSQIQNNLQQYLWVYLKDEIPNVEYPIDYIEIEEESDFQIKICFEKQQIIIQNKSKNIFYKPLLLLNQGQVDLQNRQPGQFTFQMRKLKGDYNNQLNRLFDIQNVYVY